MAFGEKRGGIRQEVPDRKILSRHCNLARMALLLPIVFTMIQVMTRYLFQTGDYLFTLFFPNILLSWDCAALLESLGLTVSNGATVQIAAQILGAALLVLFIFCWLGSKTKAGWLIAGTILFAVDTLILAIVIFLSGGVGVGNFAVDVIYHVWAMFMLLRSMRALALRKYLPPKEETAF